MPILHNVKFKCDKCERNATIWTAIDKDGEPLDRPPHFRMLGHVRCEICLAREFAAGRHDLQKQMYGKHPYVYHLDAVYEVAIEEGWGYVAEDEAWALATAAYLHDVLEDTPTTPNEILGLFGPDVLKLVSAVTNEPGKNRKERAEKTYPKIVKAGRLAIMLKLCDRIANIESCIRHAEKKGETGQLKMYLKEAASFYENLVDKPYREHDIVLPRNLVERLSSTVYEGRDTLE